MILVVVHDHLQFQRELQGILGLELTKCGHLNPDLVDNICRAVAEVVTVLLWLYL